MAKDLNVRTFWKVEVIEEETKERGHAYAQAEAKMEAYRLITQRRPRLHMLSGSEQVRCLALGDKGAGVFEAYFSVPVFDAETGEAFQVLSSEKTFEAALDQIDRIPGLLFKGLDFESSPEQAVVLLPSAEKGVEALAEGIAVGGVSGGGGVGVVSPVKKRKHKKGKWKKHRKAEEKKIEEEKMSGGAPS